MWFGENFYPPSHEMYWADVIKTGYIADQLFVCMFVCLGVNRLIQEFLTRMETSPLPVKGSVF